MKAKMLKRKEFMYIGLFTVLVGVIAFLISHKDWIVTEMLTNPPPPTLFSLNKELKDTETRLEKVETEFSQFKNQASAQSQQAAAAQASLAAIK
jgi:LPS O-antigen subunit length determinant protein (WzzB/FepE family)